MEASPSGTIASPSPDQPSNTRSGSNLFKLHEVSILDLDKEGSLLNDADSDATGMNGKTKVNLAGDLGENVNESNKELIHQPSDRTDLDRGSALDEKHEEE